MVEKDVYESLGKMTEEMYLGLAKMQSSEMQDQLVTYHDLSEQKISKLISKMSECNAGEIMQQHKRKNQILKDDFSSLKNDIGNKYKIYLRGCGNAGKSTLLNALLSVDQTIGSRMGRIPMTFTIDTYTDELGCNEAEVRKINSKGNRSSVHLSRNEAIEMEADEESDFRKSKEQCTKLINSAVKNVSLEQDREDIETDIYKKHLMKTAIREIRWGIGTNKFLHNCVLIDTPGLSQELRFTNVIEDVKNYEVDGIIWVISSETLAKAEVVKAYEKEFKEMESVYTGKQVVAVINMYGTSDDYKYGSKLWKRVETRANKIYCEQYGFSEIICVNAKLAYDGNISRNQQQIDDSNISALRKKINEMFIEKSSEEYYQTKLKKIDSFLDKFYKDVGEQISKLQEKLAQYEDIEAKIVSQKSACTMIVKEEKNKIISKHLDMIKNRIEANANRVNKLEDETESSRRYFIENTIIRVNELDNKLVTALVKAKDIIIYRLEELQKQSVISDFQTKEYALKDFQKKVGNISGKMNKSAITIRAPKGIGAGALNIAKGIFGNNSMVTSFVKGIRDSLKSPQDRVYDDIEAGIKTWAAKIGLSDEIDDYSKQCYETLEKSMEYTCGKYQDVYQLCNFMEVFMSENPEMIWKDIKLFDILGGVENV